MVHDPLKQRAAKLLGDWLRSQSPWTPALAHEFAKLIRPRGLVADPEPIARVARRGAVYRGKRCRTCGSRERYVNGRACAQCATSKARARYQRISGGGTPL